MSAVSGRSVRLRKALQGGSVSPVGVLLHYCWIFLFAKTFLNVFLLTCSMYVLVTVCDGVLTRTRCLMNQMRCVVGCILDMVLLSSINNNNENSMNSYYEYQTIAYYRPSVFEPCALWWKPSLYLEWRCNWETLTGKTAVMISITRVKYTADHSSALRCQETIIPSPFLRRRFMRVLSNESHRVSPSLWRPAPSSRRPARSFMELDAGLRSVCEKRVMIIESERRLDGGELSSQTNHRVCCVFCDLVSQKGAYNMCHRRQIFD